LAATSNGPTKIKSSILQRLPRLSTAVWILLIVCLFVIAMVPLVLGYLEQDARQQSLKMQISQLQSQTDALKAKMQTDGLKAKTPDRISPSAGIVELNAEAEKYNSYWPTIAANPDVSQSILDLAWDPAIDITIISMGVSSTNNKILGKDYPMLVYTLSLTGQVDNFQKFLRAVGNRWRTSEYTAVTITPAIVEGELDRATMTMQVYCKN
jgi:hypothetical protein